MTRIARAILALWLPVAAAAQESRQDDGETAPSPSGLSAEELARRRQALDAWTHEPVALEGSMFRFHLDRRDGSFFLQDLRTATRWLSPWGRRGFASVRIRGSGAWQPLDRVEKLAAGEKTIRFEAKAKDAAAAVVFELETMAGGAGVSLRFEVPAEHREAVEAVRLLDGALWLPDAEPGGIAVPAGLGEWHDAQRAAPLRRRLGLDGQQSVAPSALFLACLKSQSPLLVRWTDPRLAVEVERRAVADEKFPGTAGLFTTVELAGHAGQVDLLPLGKEELGVVDAVRAHRQILGARLAEASLRYKTGLRPELRSFLGAALFRLEASKEQPFAAIARRAERLKRVVGIEEAAIVVSGWEETAAAPLPSLPARKAAGGDQALAACAAAVKELGFLFGLDSRMTAGAPPDSKALLEEAKRPERWPALADGCAPQLFLLRLGASGTGAITDGARAELAAYGREQLGLWGSDVGFEGEVVHAAYIDGLLDGFTRRAADPGAWPLFAASFGSFVRLTGSPVAPDDPAAFLAHLLVGEVPTYALPPEGAKVAVPADDPRWCFAREDGWTAGQGLTPHEVFLRNTYQIASHLARIRFREPFLFHRSVVPDGSVKETYFGQDLRVLVNLGAKDYLDEDDGVLLPPHGFFVRHPFLRAFHATRVGDVTYEKPAFFVLRSLEGKMILRAESVHVYHGFGPQHLEFGGKRFEVAREAVVRVW
jgi:hypothetical protein